MTAVRMTEWNRHTAWCNGCKNRAAAFYHNLGRWRVSLMFCQICNQNLIRDYFLHLLLFGLLFVCFVLLWQELMVRHNLNQWLKGLESLTHWPVLVLNSYSAATGWPGSDRLLEKEWRLLLTSKLQATLSQFEEGSPSPETKQTAGVSAEGQTENWKFCCLLLCSRDTISALLSFHFFSDPKEELCCLSLFAVVLIKVWNTLKNVQHYPTSLTPKHND